MITIREISDDKTTISSTRWAFALSIYFDAVVIALAIAAGLVSHFVPGIEDLDSSFYGSVAMLLGVLTGVTGTAKALQGFEPRSKSDDEFQESLKEENEDK